MGFVAEASLFVLSPPETLFDRLADHASWAAWMPPSCRPVGRALAELRPGDAPRVRLAGAPTVTTLHVTVVDRTRREITWTGGLRGVLFAEHRFLFEPHEGGTRIRSIETWSGALAPVLQPIVRRIAERIGREQLAALAASAAP